ncbi:hypothetical protein BH23THE1_BH23THE1_13530 [soil metagenome]
MVIKAPHSGAMRNNILIPYLQPLSAQGGNTQSFVLRGTGNGRPPFTQTPSNKDTTTRY